MWLVICHNTAQHLNWLDLIDILTQKEIVIQESLGNFFCISLHIKEA